MLQFLSRTFRFPPLRRTGTLKLTTPPSPAATVTDLVIDDAFLLQVLQVLDFAKANHDENHFLFLSIVILLFLSFLRLHPFY
jgi:hypothetical protein